MKKTLFLLLTFTSLIATAQINLPLGLIGHYPFSGNANDISGNNINGVVTNATLTTDKYNNPNSAYYFNGTSSYILLPFSSLYDFKSSDSFSISVWVLPDQGYSWPAQAVVVKAPTHPDFTLSQWNYGTYILNYKGMGGFAFNNVLNGSTTFTPNPCWYNIIQTYKNGVWKMYVNGVLESSDATQSRYILQDGSSRIAFGKKGESFGDWYKGKMDEIRLYNRVLNQQEVDSIAGNCRLPCTQKNDFSIQRNPCIPLEVSFLSNSSGYDDIRWDFGDGNNASGVTSTTHTFSGNGSYLVTMITDYPSCSDTVKKNITVDLQNDISLITTIDTTICAGTTKKIRTTQGLNFCWSPTTYLDDPNSPEPTTSTPQNITYYYTTEVTGSNLIVNGNFNAGNSGFTSDYAFANPNTTEAQYHVGTSPQAWNASLSNCADHTGGNGNMLLVNGSPTPNLRVWTQTVNVTPNTIYSFSTWIQALWPPNPAQLQFSINGQNIGNLITATLPTCNWTQFYTSWNSGSSTTAQISIVNKNTFVQGNDFALDDISFAPVTMKRDSVRISVSTATVNTTDNLSTCESVPVQLNTTGGVVYSWTPTAGLSNPAIANPIATPTVTTRYYVTGTNAAGCSAKDSVDITILPKPAITKSADTTICENGSANLLVSGGTSYQWDPSPTLSNTSVPDPVATPTTNTKYYVTVRGANGCFNRDSIRVDVRSLNNFTISPPTSICLKKSTPLAASGGDLYTWIPAGDLDNASIATPVATPGATTTYTVQIVDTLCGNSTNLSTIITVLPLPRVDVISSNDIDCITTQSRLAAFGAAQYTWSPTASLSNSTGAGTVASPTITTLYTVNGTSAAGCENTDTVTVKVTTTNKGGYLMPTGFTPNNDGINDCYGVSLWGLITEIEFSIFNRWGERVFYTTKPGDCWNGMYKGELQNQGVFIYMIKAKTNCEPNVFRKGTFVLIR